MIEIKLDKAALAAAQKALKTAPKKVRQALVAAENRTLTAVQKDISREVTSKYSQFALYNRAPVVFVNVLNPAVHKSAITTTVTIEAGEAVIEDSVLLDSLVVKADASDEDAATEGVDYEVAYDDENLVISVLQGGALDDEEQEGVYVSYNKLDADQVTVSDVIGGIDSSTGAPKGLECLNQIFPLYGLVPGIVLAPGFSDNPAVASVMVAKAGNINEHFQASVFCDIPTGTVTKYTDVAAWKNANNYTGVDQVACWTAPSSSTPISLRPPRHVRLRTSSNMIRNTFPYFSINEEV